MQFWTSIHALCQKASAQLRRKLVELARTQGVMIITLAVALMPMATPVAAAGPESPPFTQCPADGLDTSCAILIVITDSGKSILVDSSQPPLDGIEDTLFGVQNNSSTPLNSLSIKANTDLFGFDADGLCAVTPRPNGCPFGPTSYEGPGVSFTGISADAESGTVDFANGIPPGGSAYFSLEEALQGTVVSGNLTIIQDYKQDATATTADGGVGGSWGNPNSSPPLAGSSICASQGITIYRDGCALTSVADVAYSYAIQSIPGMNTSLDPSSLNTYVANHPDLQWSKNPCATDFSDLAEAKDALPYLQVVTGNYWTTGPVMIAQIQRAISDGNLPILELQYPDPTQKDKNGNPVLDSHFVVAYKNFTDPSDPSQDDVFIANPWFGNFPILGVATPFEQSGMLLQHQSPPTAGNPNGLVPAYPQPPVNVVEMVVYHKTASPNYAHWTLRANSPVQLLVTDPNGRQTGFTTSGTPVGNIPNATYAVAGGITDPTHTTPSIPDEPTFDIEAPISGVYSVQVIGTGSGPYSLEIHAADSAGNVTSSTVIGTASPGSVDTYTVSYDSIKGGSIQPVTPTTTSAITAGTTGANGWYTSNVTVSLNATEIPSGPGVQSVTYSATGAQPIASTTVNGASASFGVSADGVTTITYYATDRAGNREQPKTLTVHIDRSAPSGTVSVVAGPPKQAIVTVQDSGSGLASIQVTESTNATYTVPAFAPGTTQPVQVAFTKVDQSQGATFALTATDTAGNIVQIDPADVGVDRATGKPVSTTITGIQGYERTLTVQNGTPGLTNLDIAVNGKHFQVTGQKDGGAATLDIGSALQPGGNNTVVLTPEGKPGGSAEVVISGSARP